MIDKMECPWSGVCPECNDAHSFIGYYLVECTNNSCKHYSKKQADQVKQYLDYIAAKIEMLPTFFPEDDDANFDAYNFDDDSEQF